MQETVQYWKSGMSSLRLTVDISPPNFGQSQMNVNVVAEEIPLRPTDNTVVVPPTNADDDDVVVDPIDEILALPSKKHRNKFMALVESKPHLVSRVPERYRREAILVVIVGVAPEYIAHIRNKSRTFFVCRAVVRKDRKLLSHVPLKRRFKIERALELEDMIRR